MRAVCVVVNRHLGGKLDVLHLAVVLRLEDVEYLLGQQLLLADVALGRNVLMFDL